MKDTFGLSGLKGDTQTHRQQGDLMSLLYFLQTKENTSTLKIMKKRNRQIDERKERMENTQVRKEKLKSNEDCTKNEREKKEAGRGKLKKTRMKE
jgi:hypothetical protein